MKTNSRGFTLIEIMVVVVIVAILAAVTYPLYTQHVAKGRQANAKAALGAAQLAMENYRAKMGTYPAAGTVIDSLPGFDIGVWQGVEPQARYFLSIEEATENYYRLRAICQPPVCNIDNDATADIWEVTSTSGAKPVNVLDDVSN